MVVGSRVCCFKSIFFPFKDLTHSGKGYGPVPVMKTILRVEDDSGDEKPLKKKSSMKKKTEPIHVAETELPVISYLNGEEETQSEFFI